MDDQNLIRVQSEVRDLCVASKRPPHACRVLPVTKTIPADRLRQLQKQSPVPTAAIEFGENKIQELKSKYQELSDLNPTWHFIGHLQSNKARDCVAMAAMLHSVDRLKLGRVLDQELQAAGKSLPILIQVNTSGEASKFGVAPDKAFQLVKDLSQFETLKIKGLMTLAILSNQSPKVRGCFQLLRQLAKEIEDAAIDKVEMTELSMGMTSDYKIAIEEGATIVRIGQGIFGPRALPDSYYWDEGS